MPELPEVEIIRRTLASKLEGRTIKWVKVQLPRLIKWPEPGIFQAIVTEKKIYKLDRKGKYLIFYLEDDIVIVIHLRMTGRLYYAAEGAAWNPYTHIAFHLDNGHTLLYADTRTLGTLYAMKAEELWRIAGLATLGPEPLTADFTPAYFSGILTRRKAKIKALLLNQKLISGLGNIYVDEALAVARINPERMSSSLSGEEVAVLFSAINQVIASGIDDGGTTFRDYRDGDGKSGSHQYHLYVYQRAGQPCRFCYTVIERKEVAGRGTHYCPKCQQ